MQSMIVKICFETFSSFIFSLTFREIVQLLSLHERIVLIIKLLIV